VQALHNAVIGSCETVVVHRMTAPADQEPVVKWLKGNVKDKVLRATIEEAMSSLADGQGYLCSGSAKIFELVQFPRAKTFDNTATPEDDAALQEVKTAAIDVDKLRGLLGEAVKEAEANDPVVLKRRIAELERDIRKGKPAAAAPGDRTRALEAAHERGRITGHEDGWREASAQLTAKQAAFWEESHKALEATLKTTVERIADFIGNQLKRPLYYHGTGKKPTNNSLVPFDEMTEHLRKGAARMVTNPDGIALRSASHPKGNGKVRRPQLNPAGLETIGIDVSVTPLQQKILDALLELEHMGVPAPARELLAFLAGYANLRSKGFTNAIGALRSGGLVEGTSLTDAGRGVAHMPAEPITVASLQRRLVEMLGGATGRILTPLIDVYPDSIEREELARFAGYENVRSKGFVNAVGRLRTLGFIDYQGREVIAKPVLFMQ